MIHRCGTQLDATRIITTITATFTLTTLVGTITTTPTGTDNYWSVIPNIDILAESVRAA